MVSEEVYPTQTAGNKDSSRAKENGGFYVQCLKPSQKVPPVLNLTTKSRYEYTVGLFHAKKPTRWRITLLDKQEGENTGKKKGQNQEKKEWGNKKSKQSLGRR
jgi:hypothetical protein